MQKHFTSNEDDPKYYIVSKIGPKIYDYLINLIPELKSYRLDEFDIFLESSESE